MNRIFSSPGPALVMAAATLVATALSAAAPLASWTVVAGPLVLVLALLATDVFQRSRSGGRALPSAGALLMAMILVLASGILATGGPGQLAGMMPILGACAALPAILASAGALTQCRRVRR